MPVFGPAGLVNSSDSLLSGFAEQIQNPSASIAVSGCQRKNTELDFHQLRQVRRILAHFSFHQSEPSASRRNRRSASSQCDEEFSGGPVSFSSGHYYEAAPVVVYA
ncbi:hypothetical protein D3C78_1572510 [compost metagenome]